ncbi:MAG: pilus assembly protein [Erysipelotrichia bacterium]|nr:pilus assembly protein [Erysipelotrichia bacterium]
MIRKRKKGQAIVEMALVFPFFLLIIVGGLIDFGFAFYNFLALQQVANDTAQWAAESNGKIGVTQNTDISQYANSKKPSWWTGTFTVHPVQVESLTTGGQILKVILSYESPTYTPFYQTIFKATTGVGYIKLATLAAYKIPEHVTTH